MSIVHRYKLAEIYSHFLPHILAGNSDKAFLRKRNTCWYPCYGRLIFIHNHRAIKSSMTKWGFKAQGCAMNDEDNHIINAKSPTLQSTAKPNWNFLW